jgi:hypothetical protein
MTRTRKGHRTAALLAVAGLMMTAAVAASCKRTWDNCYDPDRTDGPCQPTVEVVNCSNPPVPCSTSTVAVAGCSYCWTGGASPCGTGCFCQNAICYRINTLAYGATITRHRAYWPGTLPGAWATPMGGPVYVERAKQGGPINYTFCSTPTLASCLSGTPVPVVGIAGQPVVVDVDMQLDDPAATVMSGTVTWRP